eukprot:1603416-Ditylum_brightwellii.AAC.1
MEIYDFDARLEKVTKEQNGQLKLSEEVVSHIDKFIQTQYKVQHNLNFCWAIEEIKQKGLYGREDLFHLRKIDRCKSPMVLEEFNEYLHMDYLTAWRYEPSPEPHDIYKP